MNIDVKIIAGLDIKSNRQVSNISDGRQFLGMRAGGGGARNAASMATARAARTRPRRAEGVNVRVALRMASIMGLEFLPLRDGVARVAVRLMV